MVSAEDSVRALKILVVVMGVMIVLASVALVYAIVQRLGRAAEVLPATDLALHQPPGTRISGIAGVEDRLAVWVERPDGARLLMVEPKSGKILSEIRLGD